MFSLKSACNVLKKEAIIPCEHVDSLLSDYNIPENLWSALSPKKILPNTEYLKYQPKKK